MKTKKIKRKKEEEKEKEKETWRRWLRIVQVTK